MGHFFCFDWHFAGGFDWRLCRGKCYIVLLTRGGQHFVAAAEYRRRVIQLGEDPKRVFLVYLREETPLGTAEDIETRLASIPSSAILGK